MKPPPAAGSMLGLGQRPQDASAPRSAAQGIGDLLNESLAEEPGGGLSGFWYARPQLGRPVNSRYGSLKMTQPWSAC